MKNRIHSTYVSSDARAKHALEVAGLGNDFSKIRNKKSSKAVVMVALEK